MENVKMGILNVVAKWGGSVTDAFASIFVSTCFSFSALNTWRVFSMAFPSSAFAVTFAFAFFTNVFRFFLVFTFASLFSLCLLSFDFIILYGL